MMGQPAAGMAELEKAIQLAGRGTVAVGSLGYARALAGDRHGAGAIVRELLDRAKERHVPGYWVAVAYAGLGERDQVFAWLDRAFADREGILVTLNVDPFFDRVRDDPRFERLIARIGFVQSVK